MEATARDERAVTDPLNRQEFDRMWNVVDLSLSAHAKLRDRYRRRAVAVTIAVLGFSVIGATLAFAANQTVTLLGFEARLGTWLGSLSSIVFFLAIVELVVDWHRRSWSYDEATRRLGGLKARFRGAALQGNKVLDGDELRSEYDRAMSSIPSIPERQFLRLKTHHRRKVAVSKMVDRHPGAPLLFVYLMVLREGIRGVDESDGTEPVEDSPADDPETGNGMTSAADSSGEAR
jgi:hypothetical protein